MIIIIMYKCDKIDSDYYYLFLAILNRGIKVSNKASHIIKLLT